tara:strand:- start:540 stop:1544 length:1005 start_codon:yes stop_codon:yes gene_type:complete
MPRIGRHPLKHKRIKEDKTGNCLVTMTTIVYIPSQEAYWAESFKNLKIFFSSLSNNTNQTIDIMVFDNGSCEEVVNYLIMLKEKGHIQFLILSEKNLKKLGALSFLLSSAPGDYISYSDSDVYFLPGWLDESLKVLKNFPEVAKVTALPIVGGDTTKLSYKNFIQAKNDPSIMVDTGKIIPEKYVHAHCLSVGKTLQQFELANPDRKDTKMTRKKLSIYLSTADFQFTIRKESLKSVLPLVIEDKKDYFDPIYSPILEKKLDADGWWQVSTDKYLIHHIGNKKPNLQDELWWLDKDNNRVLNRLKTVSKTKHKRWFIRKILQKINTLTYNLLYE